MPTFRADFDVKSSLVLPIDAPPFVINTLSPICEITLSNGESDAHGHASGLVAKVVAQADNLDQVETLFRSLLAHQLDILSFSTHSLFKIERCMRTMEWNPYQKSRRFKAMNIFDPLYPPIQELDNVFADTVNTIANSNMPDYVIRAMRCFRYGVLDTDLESQFQNFWFAIEVIAERRKSTAKVRIVCPKCQSDLYCEKCGNHPDRLPPARQAIRQLIHDIVPATEEASEVDRVLGKVRNKLLHGSSVEAIEVEVKVPLNHVVNKIAWVAWHAIMSSMPQAILDSPLNFGHRDGQFASGNLAPRVVGSFEHDGVTEQPAEDKIPALEISLSAAHPPVHPPS